MIIRTTAGGLRVIIPSFGHGRWRTELLISKLKIISVSVFFVISFWVVDWGRYNLNCSFYE